MTCDIDPVVDLELAEAERIAGAFTPEFNCDVDVIRGDHRPAVLFNLIHIKAVATAGFVVREDVPHRLHADLLFAPSRGRESVTLYQVTRHTKHVGAAEALSADVRAECRRCSLPEPRVTPLDPRGVPGVGLVGGARLTFEVVVEGPVILGRGRHLGGGLFTGLA